MKIVYRPHLLAVASLVLLIPGAASAQEYFRTLATPADIATVVPPTPEQEQKYNIRFGEGVGVNIAAGVALEYNDNINLARHGQEESDFIFRPSAEFDASWRISDLNTLHLSLGISYAAYLDHSEFDSRGPLISPNSALEMTIHVGGILVTLRDRFSYQEDPFDLPVLHGVVDYRRFENEAGIQVDWPINEHVNLTAGYNHDDLWSFDDPQFDILNRGIETVYLKPSYLLGPNTTVGLDLSASYFHYYESGMNDGEGFLVGPYLDIGLTQNTRAYIEGGYQELTFDNGGRIGDSASSTSWYGRLQVTNQLSDYFSHHLIFSKNAELGFGQNFYTLYHVEYRRGLEGHPFALAVADRVLRILQNVRARKRGSGALRSRARGTLCAHSIGDVRSRLPISPEAVEPRRVRLSAEPGVAKHVLQFLILDYDFPPQPVRSPSCRRLRVSGGCGSGSGLRVS